MRKPGGNPTVQITPFFLAAMAACALGSANSKPMTTPTLTQDKFQYPPARKGDLVEMLHGVKVADPYRWLEDSDSSETRAWIEAENQITFGYLRSLPTREKLQKRLTEIINYEKVDVPGKVGGRYFYSRNSGLQNQSVLYVTDSLKKEPRVLLDPNTLSKDGTVALAGSSVSDDGKLLAYAIAVAGSDWMEWHVRDVDTGQDLPDRVEWAKFSGASWTKDNKGFVYGRYDQPKQGESVLQVKNVDRKLYYHRLGTPQSDDILIFNDPAKKDWFPNASITDDGRYLILTTSPTNLNRNAVYYADLKDPKDPVPALRALAGRDARPTDAQNSGAGLRARD
jgi:prolyl oligopeptidase